MRITNWNESTLYRAGEMNELVNEMDDYKIYVCALQEITWSGKGAVIKKNNYMILNSDEHGFGTGFFNQLTYHLLDFEPVNERIFKIRIVLKFCNLTLISTHAPTKEKGEVDVFYKY